jgi:arylsulfatase A-like enzyme
MIKSLDDSVGRVLDHLRANGIEEKTIVVFVSDNGGFIGVDRASGTNQPVTNNAPLRSGKGALYEGGIRVPLIVRVPGQTSAGKTCDEPVVVMDLFPTLLLAAGVSLPGTKLDGVDLSPVLKDPTAKLGRDALFFHFPHYYPTTTPVSAVREGDWKLLEYFEDDHVELYHLSEDVGERRDLAAERPEKANQLR